MWAQYMAYQSAKGSKPRQLFVTKNDVLRTEVERSFGGMGLAWRRQVEINNNQLPDQGEDSIWAVSGSDSQCKFPLFLTSEEFLDIIDKELPGQKYFLKRRN